VWGRSNLPQKSPAVLSEPKFEPPNEKFLDPPLSTQPLEGEELTEDENEPLSQMAGNFQFFESKGQYCILFKSKSFSAEVSEVLRAICRFR